MRRYRTAVFGNFMRATLVAVLTMFAHACVLAQVEPVPGSLHTTGPNAFVTGLGRIADLAIGTGGNGASAIRAQPDGKVIIAGTCTGGAGNNDFCLARLNTDGSLDATFVGPAGNGGGKFSLAVGLSQDTLTSVFVQPDQKIVLAGTCDAGFSNYDFCVVRLLPNGQLDSSFGPFGSGGAFLLPVTLAGDDFLQTALLRPNGQIVLVGRCVTSLQQFCLAQLNADGSVDTTFDAGVNANGKLVFSIAADDTYSTTALLQPDGKLVISGSCTGTVSTNFCAARLNIDGTFDADFDGPDSLNPGNGRFRFALNSTTSVATSIAQQADGKLVIAGYCSGGTDLDFCVARLNADGSFDPMFKGPAGAGAGYFLFAMAVSGNDFARSVAVQPDGKIVIGGGCAGVAGKDFCMARLYDDGTFDRSFDGPGGAANGKFLFAVGTPSTGLLDEDAFAMALQSDGRLLMAGSCTAPGSTSFCVARLNGGPHAAKQCRLDVDGDGRVGATNDTLVMTRVMSGQRGTTVITGIGFSANATRKTWPAIRDYLVAHCGLLLQ